MVRHRRNDHEILSQRNSQTCTRLEADVVELRLLALSAALFFQSRTGRHFLPSVTVLETGVNIIIAQFM